MNRPLSSAASASDDNNSHEEEEEEAVQDQSDAVDGADELTANLATHAVRVQSVSVHERHSKSDDPVLSKLGSTPLDAASKTPPSIVPSPARFSLCFDEALLEQKFRFYFFHKRLKPTRIMIPLLMLVLVLLSVYDQFYTVQEKKMMVSVLRYGVQVPLTLAWYGSTFTLIYMDFNQPMNTLVSFLVGIMNIALTIIGGEPDHGPQMLYYCLVYMFLQLRVLYATGVCWTLFLAWVAGVRVFVPGYDRLMLSAGYMLVTNLALMIACYFVEYW
jgi:hypothetical protein